MKIAIIGYARDGKVSYDYYTRLGHEVTICDQNTDLQVPQGAKTKLGDTHLDGLDEFDVIVRSSGIPGQRILDKNPGVEAKITHAVDEFLRVCPTKNTIGVTGTKGKGTTSTLIVKMLEAAGKKVFFGGNVGWSPLEFIDQITPDDWVVLELSSFQLSDIKHTTHIGVCLMVVPEHLDWHRDLDEYFLAKSRLFELQGPGDLAIYYNGNSESKEIAGYSPGIKIPYYHEPGAYIDTASGTIMIGGKAICRTDELQLVGQHNWQNVCAAVTVLWQITQDTAAIRSAAINFTGLPHRVEKVRTVNEITYFNDSFATGLHATGAAADAVAPMKVLIVGGFDRMLPLDELAHIVTKHDNDIRKVLIIGASGDRVAETLQKAGYENFVRSQAKDMPGIVADATALAQPGDCVVLSPGFASFDMFENFEKRGDLFREVVNSL